MEISAVKSVEEGEGSLARCIKRRRRFPSTAAEQQLQVDQPKSTAKRRSSRFKGVSRHRWTGRYEAHLWDKSTWNVTQRRKGKQVYLGAYDEEEAAARSYDLAAIKYWGTSTFTNFPMSDYVKEIVIMQSLTKEEYLASLRRRSSGFSRGVSKYRGVARHHHNGSWEARIGRVFGNNNLYLRTYGTQERINAVTNLDLSAYVKWLKPASNSLASQDFTSHSEHEQTLPNCIPPSKEPEIFFQPNSLSIGDLRILQKQELLELKMPASPCSKSSSPTALNILLRSSMFKELVEKNVHVPTEETVVNDMKNLSQIGRYSNENFNLPDLYSFNGEKLPHLDLEEKVLPLFDQRKTVWNDTLNIPSAIH